LRRSRIGRRRDRVVRNPIPRPIARHWLSSASDEHGRDHGLSACPIGRWGGGSGGSVSVAIAMVVVVVVGVDVVVAIAIVVGIGIVGIVGIVGVVGVVVVVAISAGTRCAVSTVPVLEAGAR
jgi:hypothetical protein